MTDIIIPVYTSLAVYYLSPLEIIRCQASNNYTWFYLTGKRKVLVAKTLGKYAAVLTDNNFIRIHRTDMVNVSHISSIEKAGVVLLTDGTTLTISKRRRQQVFKMLIRA
jgi:two-component system, LytTR family, response regulator